MKTLQLVFGLLFYSALSFCQSPDYQHLLGNGKTWDVCGGEAGGIVPYMHGERYFTQGSEIYEGREYLKVWYDLFLVINPPVFVPPFDLGSPAPYGLIREDTFDRKVYFRRFQTDLSVGEEHLIYDFNLPVGGSIEMDPGIWYILDSIAATTIENGELRRKFYFHLSDQAVGQTFYIEGVGGKNGFTNPLNEYFEYRSDLICVKRSGTILYGAGAFPAPCFDFVSASSNPQLPENFGVSPNPVSQELKISVEPGYFEVVTLYDMTGKKLGSGSIDANENTVELSVQQIPEGPFWGLLSGKNGQAQFKALKIR